MIQGTFRTEALQQPGNRVRGPLALVICTVLLASVASATPTDPLLELSLSPDGPFFTSSSLDIEVGQTIALTGRALTEYDVFMGDIFLGVDRVKDVTFGLFFWVDPFVAGGQLQLLQGILEEFQSVDEFSFVTFPSWTVEQAGLYQFFAILTMETGDTWSSTLNVNGLETAIPVPVPEPGTTVLLGLGLLGVGLRRRMIKASRAHPK